MLGSFLTQVGCLVIGIGISLHVFRDVAITEFQYRPGDVSIAALLAVALVVFGVHRSRVQLHALRHGAIMDARVTAVEMDRTGDTPEYLVAYEYLDHSGQRRSFSMNRRQKDVVVGDVLPMIVDEQRGVGFFERDLAGGVTFQQAMSAGHIPATLWTRVLLIPVLSLIPLSGFVLCVQTFLQSATALLGYPIFYWLPIIAQIVWLSLNSKHFTFKEFQLHTCERQ